MNGYQIEFGKAEVFPDIKQTCQMANIWNSTDHDLLSATATKRHQSN